MTLRIGTWNILGRCRHPDEQVAENGAVQATIAARELDVLCLQEVHYIDGQADPQLTCELTAAGLLHRAEFELSPSHLDTGARLGVLIASAHPLTEIETYKLENPQVTAIVRGRPWSLHDKGLVSALVTICGVRLRVCSLHLFPYFEFCIDERSDYVTRMWQQFWSYADQLAARWPTILAGDFNHEDREKAAAEHAGHRWEFSTAAVDQPTATNGMSLDDIVASAPLRPCLPDLRETFSDHSLVVSSIKGLGLTQSARIPRRERSQPSPYGLPLPAGTVRS